MTSRRSLENNLFLARVLETSLCRHQREAARRERDAQTASRRDKPFSNHCRTMAYRSMVEAASQLAQVRAEVAQQERGA